MARQHATSAWLGICLVAFMAGCSQTQDFSDLDRFMEETRAKPRGQVEPLPEFKAYEAFSYSAADRRAPFEPPVDVQLTMLEEQPETTVEPDLDRPREILENFGLTELQMVGTLASANESLFALIQDPEGGIHRVQKGNYAGTNYGRIVGVSETRIELLEIVPNGQGGWVERPRTLSLDEDG